MFDSGSKNKFILSSTFLIILTGIFLRLKHYTDNVSVHLDEAYLSLEIVIRSMKSIVLLESYYADMPFHPPGFLLIEKAIVSWLGPGELSLRLFPILCSIAALFMFCIFFKRFSSASTYWVALLLFSLNEPLIYFSAQVRPYGIDPLICMALFIMADTMRQEKRVRIVLYGLAGGLAMFFSYPAIFILCAAAIYLVSLCIYEKDMKRLLKFGCTFLLWLVCFFFLYLTVLQSMVNNQRVYRSPLHFVPAQGNLIEKGQWVVQSLLEVFDQPLGIAPAWLWGIVSIIGIIVLIRRNKYRMALLISPFIIVLTGSYFNKYPFGDKFLVFYIPVLLVFVAEGLFFVLEKSGTFKKKIGFILLILLFFKPIQGSAYYLFNTREKEASRPAIEFLQQHYQNQDALYMNSSAQYAYGYYHGQFDFNEKEKMIGVIIDDFYQLASFDPDKDIDFQKKVFDVKGFSRGYLFGPDIKREASQINAQLQLNPRTWLVLVHAGTSQKRLIINSFNARGKRIESFYGKNAEIHLYDMSIVSKE